MPRNKHGFLKADALRNGIDDVRAFDVAGERHVVRIGYDSSKGGFYTSHLITSLVDEGDYELHEWQCGTNLPEARAKYNAIVRSFG